MELSRDHQTSCIYGDKFSNHIDQTDEYEIFLELGKDVQPSDDYKKIWVHMICDVKHDGRHKARLVADGHLTEVPFDSVYSSVVSLRAVNLATWQN